MFFSSAAEISYYLGVSNLQLFLPLAQQQLNYFASKPSKLFLNPYLHFLSFSFQRVLCSTADGQVPIVFVGSNHDYAP